MKTISAYSKLSISTSKAWRLPAVVASDAWINGVTYRVVKYRGKTRLLYLDNDAVRGWCGESNGTVHSITLGESEIAAALALPRSADIGAAKWQVDCHAIQHFAAQVKAARQELNYYR